MKQPVWYGDRENFTEEEWNGVQKYWRLRFRYGMITVAVMLVLSAICAVTVLKKDSCTSSLYAGTWVLAEDYADGFDSDDVYIEFRAGNKYFRGGSYMGKLEPVSGEIELDKYTPMQMGSDSISADFKDDKLVLERRSTYKPMIANDYSTYYPVITSSDAGGFVLPGNLFDPTQFMQGQETVTETFVHISKQCELTEEQRAELY